MSVFEFLKDIGSKKVFIIFKINNKEFEVSSILEKHIGNKEQLIYAGKYLGKTKRYFLPSASLLQDIAKEKVNKIHVGKKTAWLFVCGRDIFERNIEKLEGKFERNEYFLVMFEGNCLGYGKVRSHKEEPILKNMFDIGDFLRRER